MDKRIEKTRKTIRETYFAMLMEDTSRHITIAELSRRANIDRKTFYLHYQSLDDVSREFSEEIVQRIHSMMQQTDFHPDLPDAYRLLAAINDTVRKDLSVYQKLSRSSDAQYLWTCMEEALIRKIVQVYQERVDITSAQLDVYARFFSSGLLTVCRDYLRGEFDMTMEELGQFILRTSLLI